MAITWAQVTDIAPELAAVLPPMRAAVLEYAELHISAAAWGSRADMGRAYIAAHLATVMLRRGTGPSGAVVSETVGDVSTTYAQAAAGLPGSAFGSTTYGQMYMGLIQMLPNARLGMVV